MLPKIYKQLGATTHRHDAEESLCHDEYEYGACNELSAQGEPFDFNTWIEEKKQNINEHDRADRIAERQLRIDRAERDQEKDQRHAEIAGLVQGLTDTAVSLYGNYQAGVAQARVNAETIRLSQQNKGAGGNPTTSSGGSSSNSSSSSTVSSKAAPNKSSTAATSDSSDSSSDSSASSGTASKADMPFNVYSSTGGGYNPYSGQGVPAVGSTIPGKKGHWIEEEYIVTYVSISVRHANINLSLVNNAGRDGRAWSVRQI